MTGRINFTPEARQQLHHLDEWITEKASADTARRFVAAILDHPQDPGLPACWPSARRHTTGNADDQLQEADPRRL